MEEVKLTPEEKLQLAQIEMEKEYQEKIKKVANEIQEILQREGLMLKIEHIVRIESIQK